MASTAMMMENRLMLTSFPWLFDWFLKKISPRFGFAPLCTEICASDATSRASKALLIILIR